MGGCGVSKIALLGQRTYWGNDCAVFEIGTRDKGLVYMRINRTPENSRRHGVVIVDAWKFLEVCRSHPYHPEPALFRDEAGWRADYKYSHAERNFALGLSNPVPVAEVGVFSRSGCPTTAAFVNGVTRTIWLLANGADAFPVDCEFNRAEALREAAGASGFPIWCVADLVKESRHGALCG